MQRTSSRVGAFLAAFGLIFMLIPESGDAQSRGRGGGGPLRWPIWRWRALGEPRRREPFFPWRQSCQPWWRAFGEPRRRAPFFQWRQPCQPWWWAPFFQWSQPFQPWWRAFGEPRWRAPFFQWCQPWWWALGF